MRRWQSKWCGRPKTHCIGAEPPSIALASTPLALAPIEKAFLQTPHSNPATAYTGMLAPEISDAYLPADCRMRYILFVETRP